MGAAVGYLAGGEREGYTGAVEAACSAHVQLDEAARFTRPRPSWLIAPAVKCLRWKPRRRRLVLPVASRCGSGSAWRRFTKCRAAIKNTLRGRAADVESLLRW